MKFALLSLLCLAAGALPAYAASSSWQEGTGGRIRLVTTGAPDAQGHLRGALEIDLEPGWKTYWRDPGSAGVPPSLDVSASPWLAGATLSFPVPERHHEENASWAGYDRPVAFPVTFLASPGAARGIVTAKVFLGLCEDICIPFAATLTLDPGEGADDPADARAVADAEARLPDPARPGFEAKLVAGQEHALAIRAILPEGAAAIDLFVSGEGSYMFDMPQPAEGGDGKLFTLRILDAPATRPDLAGLPYTLVAGDRAVSGLLPLP